MKREQIVELISKERERQIKKWGENQDLSLPEWMSILTEEVGEAAKEANDYHVTLKAEFNDWNDMHINGVTKKKWEEFSNAKYLSNYTDFKTELIQVAAVCFNILESIE